LAATFTNIFYCLLWPLCQNFPFTKGPFYIKRGAEKRADGLAGGRSEERGAQGGGVRIPKGLFAALLFLLFGCCAAQHLTLARCCAAWLSLSAVAAALLSLCRLLFSLAKSRAEAAIDVACGPSPHA